MDSSSSSAVPEVQRRPDNMQFSGANKKLRLDTSADDNSYEVDRSTPTTMTGPTAHSEVGSFDALPAVVLVQIAAYSPASSLSGASRFTLSAIRELHYKMNMRTTWVPNLDGHMGLQASGTLATGRVVTRITVDVLGQGGQVSTNE